MPDTRKMPYPPIPQRFLEAVDKYDRPQAQLFKIAGTWQPVSSQELLRRVAGLSSALAELGIGAGDRVGLFAPNRPEWHVADLAVLGLGAVVVPLYFNESVQRIVYIVNHAGAKAVITAGEMQAARLAECRPQLATVEHVLAAAAPPNLNSDVLRVETLIAQAGAEQIAEYRQRAALLTGDQLATLIYTSGTTGEPKGVMLSHSNLSSNEIDSFSESDHSPDDIGVSFLPLSHVYERMIDYGYLFRGISIAYVDRMEDLPQALREVRPTVVAAVPRVFEKIHANILEKARELSGRRRKIFDWAMGVALRALPWRGYGKPVALRVKLQWYLADRIVYSRVRAAVGGRIRSFISGSAPLAKPLLEFFWSIGIPIYQGYGLTEASPVVTSSNPKRNKLGCVGPAIPNVEIKIAEDGEILVRGPNVMRGYYKRVEDTSHTLTEDGWLRTGDIGTLDAEGFLTITDRKKELLKTAAGKYVAPQPIENELKSCSLISNAAVFGDRRRFVTALIVPEFAAVEARLKDAGIEIPSHAGLAAHPLVRAWVGAEVESVNAKLAQYETVKRFEILDHEFTFDGGQLTYTMKLKRRAIEEHYAALIEKMYEEKSEIQT